MTHTHNCKQAKEKAETEAMNNPTLRLTQRYLVVAAAHDFEVVNLQRHDRVRVALQRQRTEPRASVPHLDQVVSATAHHAERVRPLHGIHLSMRRIKPGKKGMTNSKPGAKPVADQN